MFKEHELIIPLEVSHLQRVEYGDKVYLSGIMFTARPAWYRRVLDLGRDLPVDLKKLGANVLLHAGPVVRRVPATREWEVVAIVPMPDWIADGSDGNVAKIIKKVGLRAVIGKGKLKKAKEIFGDNQCLHLITIGTWNNFARRIKRVNRVEWLDLGLTEAMWFFEVERMGPFIVETDIKGQSLYERIRAEQDTKISEVLERRGLANL